MAISKELLEILVCPACKGPIELRPDHSGLHCAHCRLLYPIVDEIPVLRKDEALPDSEAIPNDPA